MAQKQTTITDTTETKRTPPDKSPENDLRKALDHLRSARAKYIRGGDEEKGSWTLELIGRLDLTLEQIRKPAAGA